MNITQTPNQILDEIAVNVRTILTGGNVVRPSGIQLVRLDTQFSYRLEVTDVDGTLVQPERIVPGRVRIVRHRPVNQNWDMVGEVDEHYLSIDGGIIPGDPSNPYDSRVEPGNITQAYTFWSTPTPERPELDGWKVGDEFAIIWSGVKVLDEDDPEVVVTEFAPTWYSGSVTDLAGIDTDVQMIRLHVESPTYGLQAIADKIDGLPTPPSSSDLAVLNTKLDGIVADLNSEPSALPALKTLIETGNADALAAKNYADILDHSTAGLVAIRAEIDKLATGAGPVLVTAPAASSPLSGWAASAPWSLSSDVEVYRSSPGAIRMTCVNGTNSLQGARIRLDGLAKRSGRYYGSCWVFSPTAGLEVFMSTWTTGHEQHRKFGPNVTLAANTWTRIEGIATLDNPADGGDLYFGVRVVHGELGDYVVFDDLVVVELDTDFDDYALRTLLGELQHATYGLNALRSAVDTQTDILTDPTNGNAAIKTAVVARATPADVLAQAKAALNTAVDGSNVPVPNSLYDILHKNGSYTFDNSTDSLEAIRDLLDTFNAPHVGRSADSGSTLMDGTEKILYEESITTPWEFKGGWIDLTALADTRSVTVKIYVKIKSGGSYIEVSSVTFTGADDAKVYPIPSSFPIGGTSYQCNLPHFWNVYGVKVTAQQTVLGGGYVTIDAEFYDTRSA